MKKTYSTPVVDVKKFDVADVITTSAVGTKTATIQGDGAGNNTVEIVAKW